ncbi:MAG TPA: hypothetical protein PKX92_09945 [Edaphocola sp.]|nr:hypothetical protein [Edaphocola sp.]
MKSIIPIFALCLASNLGQTQVKKDPPINFETLVGIKRSNSALTMNKTIEGNFRFSNITSVAAFYDKDKGATELVSVNSVGYQIHKNIGVYTGIQYHYSKGFMPHIAVSFAHATPDFLIAITPYFNFMPFYGLETIGVMEYKPKIGNNTRLFTRVQAFYGHNFEAKSWAREMLYFRAGLSIKQFTFGLASQFDYYVVGNKQILDYGPFLRMAL